MSIQKMKALVVSALLLGLAAPVVAQEASPQSTKRANGRDTATTIEVYGFAQADMIYDFLQNNPDWFDVNRPSRLPAIDNEFGFDHRMWFSVRQSKLGVKATIPTKTKPVTAVFEWDLFGVGVDAGQTTIRPRHIYGQWGQFGAGQTNSVFMDIDIFPNILDYWGPNGMLFFRNVMVWWQPIDKPNGTRFTFSLERPGASGDGGRFADRIELQNIRARFPAPDIAAAYRYGGKFGYVRLSSMVRWIYWDDILLDPFDLTGHTTGWGVALSTSLNATKSTVVRLMGIYGAGVENYFNDAPIDVGVRFNPGNAIRPLEGEALPNTGLVAFVEHRWNSTLTTAAGWSMVNIDNSDAQAPTAFHQGQYALANLLWTPVPRVMMGGEFQFANRENFNDAFNEFDSNDFRLQFSFRYSYSQKFGGNGK